jgi:F0F1-type ATP synthase membrane subunit b/b'
MNIIKLQNELKGVPDNALIGYVQNPTGRVPTYLALSELQRRKEMRNSYQANKPEEKTVAEDLVQEAQPQPQPQMEGVAGLPQAQPMMQAMAPPPEMPMQQMAQGGLAELDVGDMFNEQSYADGGIVAFADGGDSNKEDTLGLPSLSPDMSMGSNAGAGNLAMLQSAMQPTQGMQGNVPMTQGQMPDQSNDSLIAKVIANLKADANYQPENPIEAAIVKQIRGTDPMQQGQPSQQGLGSLAPAQPSQPMAPSYNPSQPMAPSYAPSVAMGPTYYAGMNAPQGYADGGIVAFADGGDTEKGMNLDALPSLNLGTGESVPQNIDPAQLDARPYNRDMLPYLQMAIPGFTRNDEPRYTNAMTAMVDRMVGVKKQDPSSRPANAMTAMYEHMLDRSQNMAQGGEVKHFQQGGPSQASLKYQAALADSYLDPRYLVSGAQDLVSRNLFGYRVVRDPVTGELIQAKDLPSSTDALRKKKKSEVEELLDKAEKIKEEKKSEATKKENLTELDPTLAATTFNKDALYKDPNMSELYAIAKPRIQALPEKSKIPPNATQEFNPYANVEKPKSTVNTAEETARRFQEMMGADSEREDLRKKVQDLELGSKEQERMAPWLSLARAGFGIAAGKSPFALQNIGEGAQLGITEYVAARDRLDKLNERRLDIRSRLNQVERGEKAAGVSAGLTKELKEMEELNANARNAATGQVQLKTAAIAAAKKSDFETYLSLAQQDPDNYKLVKNPETGESTKVFDAPKVTQAYKSFSGSSGLDDDKILALWQQEKMMDKNFKMPFKDFANMIRSGTGGTTQSTTPTKSLNNIFK